MYEAHSHPPRFLPFLSRMVMLFGGTYALIGWIFFGVGMIFTLIFTPFWYIGLVAAIFPLVGLIFIGISLKRNVKSIDLLIHGVFTRGRLIEKKPTHVKINEMPVYHFKFQFSADDGQSYICEGRTHQPYLVEDEWQERILYLKSDPTFSVLYDLIPFSPKLLPDGSLAPPPPASLWVLLAPGLTILAHLILLILIWF